MYTDGRVGCGAGEERIVGCYYIGQKVRRMKGGWWRKGGWIGGLVHRREERKGERGAVWGSLHALLEYLSILKTKLCRRKAAK